MRRLVPGIRRAGDSVAMSTMFTTGIQVAIYGFALLTSVLIARALGPGGRGEYYLATTSVTVALILLHLSVEAAGSYAYAERGVTLRALSRNAALLALILGPVAVLLLLGFYALTRDSLLSGVGFTGYALLVASVPFGLHLLWMANLFALSKRLPQSQLARLAGAVIQLGVVVPLYLSGKVSVTAVLALYAAVVMAPWAIHVAVARSFAPARPGVDRDVLRLVLVYGLKLHAGFLFIYLLLRLDVYFVKHFLGTDAVGVYSLAVQFAELVWMLTTPLAIAALPFQADQERTLAASLSFRAARFNLLVGIVLAAVFAAVLWWAIPVLYGRGFDDAYGAMLLLMPGILATAFSRPLLNWLIRDNRPLRWIGLAFAGLTLNCVLNIVLIPVLGIDGASIASSVAYLAMAAAYTAWGVALAPFGWRASVMPQRSDVEMLRRLGRRAGRAVSRFRAHS